MEQAFGRQASEAALRWRPSVQKAIDISCAACVLQSMCVLDDEEWDVERVEVELGHPEEDDSNDVRVAADAVLAKKPSGLLEASKGHRKGQGVPLPRVPQYSY